MHFTNFLKSHFLKLAGIYSLYISNNVIDLNLKIKGQLELARMKVE